mgnify:CR=1 FL=1
MLSIEDDRRDSRNFGPFDAHDPPTLRGLRSAFVTYNPRTDDEKSSVPTTTDEETITEIRRDLTRVHLPILDAAGFIDWDRETSVVTTGPRFDEFTALLDTIEDEEPDSPPPNGSTNQVVSGTAPG